jgi:hypothetical protein
MVLSTGPSPVYRSWTPSKHVERHPATGVEAHAFALEPDPLLDVRTSVAAQAHGAAAVDDPVPGYDGA